MTQNKNPPRWPRVVVAINAVVFLAFGAIFMLFPSQLISELEIGATSATALADVRAMYGGLSLACGLLFLASLRKASWLAPSLFLVITTSAGLAFGRLYSIAVTGMPSNLILANLGVELASCVVTVFAYRALGEPIRVDAAWPQTRTTGA